jgi:trehalose 2-sulfotransferase
MPVTLTADKKPVRFVTDARLDFNHSTPLRKSYVVASSYRCGSQYLCWCLWQTGLLGAPSEVLNPRSEMRVLTKRFKTSSPADYLATLIARRTSKNGVFGVKAHFHHFEAFMKDYPALLEALSPVTYIYINRSDKVAQAVSMAKALQTDWWSSRMESGPSPPLRYDGELIAKCMQELEQQDQNWRHWFERHNVTPFPVTYNDLTANAAGVVRGVVELLGVQDDEPEEVDVPPAKKQGDETNQEWIERFEQEARVSEERREADAGDVDDRVLTADAGSPRATASGHFFDRYDRLIKRLPGGTSSVTGFMASIRLRRRYDAIISQNRELLHDARVLVIGSFHGFWSLAALDAGAAHVVGVETSRGLAEAAEKNLAERGIKSQSYQFAVRSSVFGALRTFSPEAFDVILCKGFFEQSHFSLFFRQLSRLRPKHVILDTRIGRGRGPTVRFTKGSNGAITSTPNHELITFLCESDFRWRLIDWQAMGVTDWTGVQDYATDRHRTYVLDRL